MNEKVAGFCADRFAAVRDAFTHNFSSEEELGAACCIYLHGEKIVDLWGGLADEDSGAAWQEDTLCGFYSTGKPLAGLGLLQMIDAGRIKLDDPVAGSWPEFSEANKAAVTFRQLLCHQAGLPAVRKRLPEGAMLDWEMMVSELAAQEPWWEPGTRHVYHTNTYGYLVGEPVRRLTGLSPGQYMREKISGPLGVEVYIGVPDDALDRVATLKWESSGGVPDSSVLDRAMSDEERMLLYAVRNPSGLSSLGVMNTRAWRQGEVPSTNGHGTARGVARIYSALVSPGEDDRLLSPEMLKEATSLQSEGYCPALQREVSFALGFQCTRPDRPLGPNPSSFGHFGTGGSLGFADPQTGVGFGYVMNRIKPRWQNPRNKALLKALYDSL
jgi:CubicO group peptidase (beta-lactamase class C family)|tara:strand:+ start:11641 stop:12792 length:1152 start_codon:yes stop_codon:yes gene_type:complete